MFKSTNKNLTAQTGWLILFCAVLLDSLVNYFVHNIAGHIIAINALLPFWFIIMIVKGGIKQATPPLSAAIWLTIAIFGFLSGINLNSGFSLLTEMATASIAYAIGIGAGRWNNNASDFVRIFLIIGGAYVLVCTIAILHLAPTIMPITNDIGNYQGNIIIRPSVTIDQNFQIFYIFLPALVLSIRFKLFVSGLAILFSILIYFIMAKLQTRSGMLLMTNLVLLSLIAPLLYPKLGRKKVIIIPLAAIILISINIDNILSISQEFVQRITQENRFDTLKGRIYSAQYMFDNLLNVDFWIPRGEGGFIKKTGNLPHFTPTSFYLQGGLIAIVAWVAIFMHPLISMTRFFLNKKLDSAAIMIYFGGITSFIAQLTLNATFFEQIWLWAGAVTGTINRIQANRTTNQ